MTKVRKYLKEKKQNDKKGEILGCFRTQSVDLGQEQRTFSRKKARKHCRYENSSYLCIVKRKLWHL